VSDSQDQSATARHRWRVRLYRFAANFMLLFILPVVVLVNVVRWIAPSYDPNYFAVLWFPFLAAMVLMTVPWFLAQCGFMFGLIKCPACRQSYAAGFRPYIKPTCESCGVDIRGRGGAVTSNKSLERTRER